MGRLIDADLLKKNIAKWLQGCDPQETEMVKLYDIVASIVMEIVEQPTAYSVENVVAELEEFAEINEEKYKRYKNHPMVYEYERSYAQVVAYKHAIDIVKRGGVDERD